MENTQSDINYVAVSGICAFEDEYGNILFATTEGEAVSLALRYEPFSLFRRVNNKHTPI